MVSVILLLASPLSRRHLMSMSHHERYVSPVISTCHQQLGRYLTVGVTCNAIQALVNNISA